MKFTIFTLRSLFFLSVCCNHAYSKTAPEKTSSPATREASGSAAPLLAGCTPFSTMECADLKVNLPFTLSFASAVSGTIADKNGQGTGFRTVNTYSGTRLAADGSPSVVDVPGYEPSKLTLGSGRLQIVTNKGIDFLTNNNQINALGVRVQTVSKFQLEVKLVNPFNGAQSQQAGLWYGLNDKTFVKLGVSGNRIELRKETNDVSSSITGTGNPDQRRTETVSNLNTQTVWLRLVVDAATNTVEGFYSTNGVNYISTGALYSTPTLNIAGMGLTSGEVYAGIFSTHRNGTAAVTYTFDDFAATDISAAAPISAKINFRPSGSAAPAGYTADNGLPFDAARKYGWIIASSQQPSNYSANMRLRSGTGDARQLSLVQVQSATDNTAPGAWEYVVPNGSYRVVVSAGDNNYYNSNHQVNVEGLPAISDFTPSAQNKFRVATATVQVSDGKLTLSATGGTNTKINYVTIDPANAVNDAVAPVASARFTGNLMSAGVYDGPVKIFATATDAGGSGLKTLQYALNGGGYTNYTEPFNVTTPGSYTLRIRATDANNNETVTSAYNFSIYAPPAASPYMVLKNMDNFPANDQLVFSRIQIPWRRTSPAVTPYNRNHDQVTLRISSAGASSLVVNSLSLSNPSAWQIVSVNNNTSPAYPLTINTPNFADVVIRFTAVDAATRVRIFHDSLTIVSNDNATPAKKVALHGLYQRQGEGRNEPYAQEIINAFGFTSNTGYTATDGSIMGSTVVPNSNEVTASYFVRADNTKPVTVYQLAAYHGCCASVESFRYFNKGSGSNTILFTHDPLDGQSLLPHLRNSTTQLATGTFSPAGSFGMRLALSSSDRTQNGGSLIGLRFIKVLDSNGNVVPNAYFVNHDYINNSSTNYDYQDNLFYVENIKPEAGTVNYSTLEAISSSAVNFNPTLTGANTAVNVTLKNQGLTYANGSSDPSILVKNIRIAGPNANEFSVGTLSSMTIPVQGTTPLNVRFAPTSVGIKNAVLLITYNNSPLPLRIPLYGIANSSTATVSTVRRIKSGSNSSLTVGGNVYESDQAFRTGSVQLDTQTPTTNVAGTDIDALYQTYLSASANLAQTGYNIPLANGNYLIRMHFVENFFTIPGSRVFSATIEDQPVLYNLDIFNEAGYRAALVKDFSTTVVGGVLNIRFNPSVNRVALAAVEIFSVSGSGARMGAEELVSDFETGPKQINVYPNPVTGGIINLNANNFGKNEKITVSVTSISGLTVQSETLTTDSEGSGTIALHINSSMTKGIYIISASDAKDVVRSKIVIE
ncbi:malectin domain-containing carbohydrate-binding protein [Dyadobacter bucti]|uniref:malectin domain-containing carbohydrate-binding protein n=1 Tax=Dyadobacter bucti TaxID=2572203 RepID=UPI0011098472|nr:malectin domain-containing carbohydrate-binding protein [Dyadobacter bucti]